MLAGKLLPPFLSSKRGKKEKKKKKKNQSQAGWTGLWSNEEICNLQVGVREHDVSVKDYNFTTSRSILTPGEFCKYQIAHTGAYVFDREAQYKRKSV